jgi:hypothetical protein
VLEPLPAHDEELVLGEGRVDMGERDRVERQVPRGEPRVLPLVGHREDVGGVEVAPGRIAAGQAAGRRRWAGGVAVEPAADVVRVELLAPEHPRERLAHDHRLVVGSTRPLQLRVELVGLGAAGVHRRRERRGEQVTGRGLVRNRRRFQQAQPDLGRVAGRNR